MFANEIRLPDERYVRTDLRSSARCLDDGDRDHPGFIFKAPNVVAERPQVGARRQFEVVPLAAVR